MDQVEIVAVVLLVVAMGLAGYFVYKDRVLAVIISLVFIMVLGCYMSYRCDVINEKNRRKKLVDEITSRITEKLTKENTVCPVCGSQLKKEKSNE